ncbi:MAG: glycoside hydrolase family 9 protein [Bryobacteraceae bacterium]|jgi:endoglucanase
MKRTILWLAAVSALAATPTTEIKVDQAGYLPGEPKVALVVSKTAAEHFTVRRIADGRVVLRGRLGAPVNDADSGDRVQAADFTKLTRRGTYYLEVPGVGRSWDFAIGDDVYARAYYLAMRSFYGQRCGTAVDLGPEFPGYAYPACHLKGAYHASSGRSGPAPSIHGWHDAGDYGRYVVNSGITTGTLLWTWELYGSRVGKVKLNIPESGNGTPDILNEIRWNLDWMLSMQDEDGGVWQKQTSERFCGFIMPQNDTAVSYVIGTGREPYKSSCATADLAAVMGIAARVYRPFDAAYAERCLRAARQAWNWLGKYPDVVFRNPASVATGEYGDAHCGDERLWAAAELWRSTGEEAYHRYFLEHFGEYRATVQSVAAEGWGSVAPLGLWTYVLGGGKDAAAVAAIRRDSLGAADGVVERTNRNGYRISMTATDYVWGSNGVAANYGMRLLVANALRPDRRYVRAALDNLHYLLGRNTFSLSWVTQVGANPYRHPHHRPSAADGKPEPWPGLLSGGPNRARQDALLRRLPADLPPAKMYVDSEGSYASNEVAINWNAALVFVLAGVLPEK